VNELSDAPEHVVTVRWRRAPVRSRGSVVPGYQFAMELDGRMLESGLTTDRDAVRSAAQYGVALQLSRDVDAGVQALKTGLMNSSDLHDIPCGELGQIIQTLAKHGRLRDVLEELSAKGGSA
jgi:hypothetical protein